MNTRETMQSNLMKVNRMKMKIRLYEIIGVPTATRDQVFKDPLDRHGGHQR
jgi:hypothetical protein